MIVSQSERAGLLARGREGCADPGDALGGLACAGGGGGGAASS